VPNHKSAIKRVRQNKKRNARNTVIRSVARTEVKNVLAAIASGNKEEAEKALKSATSVFDSSVTKGVHHRNNASRRVSRLARRVNKMS